MRRHILHRTVSVFLLICLLLSFTACTKLRAKRLEFTPYYSEHIASAYEQTSPTLLMSEPVPKDFDKDASVLVPYFHYAVYKPSTGFAAVDQAAEAYINAQLDTAEAMYRQDAALNMDYSLNVLDNKLGQLYIYGFSCTLADQQPQGDMLRTALFYNAQDGTLFTMDDILKSETYANFCQMADDLLYSTAQIDISVTSITADTFAAAFQFHTEGLTLHFEAGTFGNEQTDAIDIGIDYETLAPYVAEPLYELLEETHLPLRGRKLDPTKPMIAFTFDDGPSKYTPRIAELLERYNGLGTFFVVGNRIDNFKDAFMRCVEGGHELANHTWEHKNLKTNSYETGYDQLTKTNKKIEELSGKKPALIRPVGGAVDDDVRRLSRDLKMPLINWNVDTLDWKTRDADAVYNECVRAAGNGSIVLFHDLYETTWQAVERLVPYYASKGYQFVTVSELLQYAEDATIVYGDVYYDQNSHR